jgi:hypothetical protein
LEEIQRLEDALRRGQVPAAASEHDSDSEEDAKKPVKAQRGKAAAKHVEKPAEKPIHHEKPVEKTIHHENPAVMEEHVEKPDSLEVPDEDEGRKRKRKAAPARGKKTSPEPEVKRKRAASKAKSPDPEEPEEPERKRLRSASPAGDIKEEIRALGPLAKLTVVQLKEWIHKADLSDHGLKKDMVARLEEFIE